MRRLWSLACFASLICLAACGTHYWTMLSTPSTPLTGPPPTKLVTIGNSITLHPPDAPLSWSGNWGMAASAQARDYAHVTAAAMNLPVTPITVAAVEVIPNDLSTYLPVIAGAGINSTTIVVLEMGDDVPNSEVTEFTATYGKILNAVSARLRLVCLSTFWERPWVDAIIKPACESNGGFYVYIGDIDTDSNNPDYKVKVFSNPAVNVHPHDWGMAQISARIIAEVNPGR